MWREPLFNMRRVAALPIMVDHVDFGESDQRPTIRVGGCNIVQEPTGWHIQPARTDSTPQARVAEFFWGTAGDTGQDDAATQAVVRALALVRSKLTQLALEPEEIVTSTCEVEELEQDKARQEDQEETEEVENGIQLSVSKPRPFPDFVAPANYMRKLFKLQQSKAAVHVAIKRVGGTLVLDGVLNHFLDSWAVTGEEWQIMEVSCTMHNGTVKSSECQNKNRASYLLSTVCKT